MSPSRRGAPSHKAPSTGWRRGTATPTREARHRAPAPSGGIGRRGFILGGVGVVGLAAGGGVAAVVAGREPDRPAASLARAPRSGGGLVSDAFTSQARGGVRTGWTVAYPEGTATDAELPVLVVLHGRGGNHLTAFNGLGMDRHLDATVAAGAAPFAVVSVDGGDGYWRAEPGGADAGRMVVEELLPLLERRGLQVDRVALAGWSMGGYGALRLAGLDLLPATSVATVAPAVSVAERTEADDVLGNPQRLVGLPVQVSVGEQDVYRAVGEELVQRLRGAGVEVEVNGGPGSHSKEDWQRYVPDLLDFTARHLSA